MKKVLSSSQLTQIILTAIMVLACLLILFPLFFMLMTSFRTDHDVMYNGFALLPEKFTLQTYKEVLSNTQSAPIINWYANSFTVAVSTGLLVVLIDSMAAYGYARMKFACRDIIFAFLMFTMMIPSVINLIPTYSIVSALRLKNSVWALILPALSGVGNIFLIRQFFYSIPRELDEAATIDGAGSLRTFFWILIPQLKPVLIVVFLFTFLGSWNDLLWPLIIITDVRRTTLTAGLSIINGEYDREYASKMAATTLSVIPALMVYIIFQRYLLEGVSLSSGIKG